MKSCIYEGTVRHRRFVPVENSFRYRLFLMYLDLAELPTLFDGHAPWSYDRPNVAYLRRKDHLGDPNIPLDQAVRQLVQEKLGTVPSGPIRLLTHLRYFGYCFNPVSFYYCYDQSDQYVETIVAEVSNTPWGERYPYVLGENRNEHPDKDWKRYQFAKAFHVSPFMDLDIWYDWRFRVPGELLNVHINNIQNGRKIFDATLTLHRRDISSWGLTRVLMAYPFMTLKVITMIHWQALRLWRKGAIFYPHPGKRKA